MAQGALVDITVKTLDGQNRTFHVPENLNVRQFKEKIGNSVEIPADSQRLIFQGRVMQDDKILKDYDIHGKVIHLVQRAPPSSASASSSSTSTAAATSAPDRPHIPMDGNHFDVQIHVGRVQNTPTTLEARARLRQADFNLRLVNDVLTQLEQRLGSLSDNSVTQGAQEPPVSTATGPADITRQPEDSGRDTPDVLNTDSASQEGSREQPRPQPQSSSENVDQARPQPQNSTQPTGDALGLMAADLANFLDQVLSTNERVASHIRLYRDILRNEVTYPAMSREARDAQEVACRATEVFHALGHMLHSLSDVAVDMATDMPRQAVATPSGPFPFPGIPGTASMAIPIHMNLRARQNRAQAAEHRRRQRQNVASSAATSATASTSTVPTPSTAAAPSSTSATTAPTLSVINISSGGSQGPSISQIPHIPLVLPPNVSTSGEPSVMVEVLPAAITVHDIRAVVAAADGNDIADSSSDSNGSDTTNITIIPAVNPGLPFPSSDAASSAAATTTSSAAPSSASSTLPAATSTPLTTNTGMFISAGTSPQAFILGPGTSMSLREVPNFGLGQMPSFGSGQWPRVPGLPGGMLQNIVGSILNSHGGVSTTQPNPFYINISAGNQANTATSSTITPSRTTAATTGTSTTSRNSFPVSFSWSNPTSQSSVTDPSPNIRVASAPRPQIHFQPFSPAGQTRPQQGHPRPPTAGPLRRSYVDPYLPCSSPHYTSQTALATFSAMQTQARGQQVPEQMPNLNTLVSGIVGEIMEQAVTAAANGGNQTRPSAATTTSSSSSSSSVPLRAATSASSLGATALNPLEMFAHLLNRDASQFGPPNPAVIAAASGGNQTHPNTATTTSSSSSSSIPLRAATSASSLGATTLNPLEMFAHLLNRDASQFGPPTPGNIQSQGSRTTTATSTTTTERENAASPAHWTMELFTRVRPATEDGPGAVTVLSLLEAVAPHMGPTDLFSLFLGNTHVLNQLRQPLQVFVRRQVAHFGSVDRVVEAVLADMYPEIQHIQTLVELKDEFDLAQSLRNCLRVHLTTIFSALDSDHTGSAGDFGSHMYRLWMKMLADSIGLCIYCLRDGQTGFSNLVQSYMPRMTQGINPAITAWMTSSLQDIFQSFHHNHPVTDSDVVTYVVKQDPERSPVPTSQERGQSSVSVDHLSAVCTGLTSGVSPGSVDEASSLSPMDTTESPPSESPQAEVARTIREEDLDDSDTYEDAQETIIDQISVQTHPTTLAVQAHHIERPVERRGNLRNGRSPDDWQSVVPQDWVPVINQDIIRQQTQRPQAPLSDTYLQGLPAKRRRMMSLEHADEMGNMPLYLPASLKRAAQAADAEPISSEENMAQEAADDLDLQAELEREVIRMLASRLTSDQDFTSDRFPNAKEYFHKPDHH